MKKNIIECLRSITLKIRCNNHENDLKRIEHKGMFKALSNLDKINYILEYADTEILTTREEIQETKKISK